MGSTPPAPGLPPEGGNDFSSLAFESDCQVRLVMAKPLPAARPIVAQIPTKKPDCAELAPLPNVDQFMAEKLGEPGWITPKGFWADINTPRKRHRPNVPSPRSNHPLRRPPQRHKIEIGKPEVLAQALRVNSAEPGDHRWRVTLQLVVTTLASLGGRTTTFSTV